MRLITSLLIILSCSIAHAKQLVVAVIDTGIDVSLLNKNTFCKTGHKFFAGTSLMDNHGHGTHVSYLIDQYAKNVILGNSTISQLESAKVNYCQIIIKFYDPNDNQNSHLSMTKSIKWAIQQKVDIINISGGGRMFVPDEHKAIIEALNKGIVVVAAAGNDSSNLGRSTYYPAMYDKRIYVVGNIVNNSRIIARTSNYGKPVNSWEIGENVLSRFPNNSVGYLSGTSQATAIRTGKIVRKVMMKSR